MDLQALTKQISGLESAGPIDQWQPTNCGKIDIKIKQDGTWLHNGSAITRLKLVKLFAQVLVCEEGKYYLKTPVEKMEIEVETYPFVITQWQLHDTDQGQAIEVISNLEHRVILSAEHKLEIADNRDQPNLVVTLHHNLQAMVHRNVYYQWIELAQEQKIDNKTHLVLHSATASFSLGCID